MRFTRIPRRCQRHSPRGGKRNQWRRVSAAEPGRWDLKDLTHISEEAQRAARSSVADSMQFRITPAFWQLGGSFSFVGSQVERGSAVQASQGIKVCVQVS